MQRRHFETAAYLFCSILTSLLILVYANVSTGKVAVPKMTAQTFEMMKLAVTGEAAEATPTSFVAPTLKLEIAKVETATCSASEEAGPSPCQALLEKIEVSLAPTAPVQGELCEDTVPEIPAQWLASI